ncbi:TPA: DUF3278 domain-containing protein [Streptococcus agalactiae]|nr:DUF3278 domain-containing protein [Streptococcus agalactiae]HEO8413432.1 DUF3278 domain-containing protein [Streptococcus agalactiae]
MKEKKNLGIKLIKSLYGINGPFDEYREQKINYLGNLLFATTSLYHILSSIIAWFTVSKYPTETAYTLLALTFFLYFCIFLIVIPSYLNSHDLITSLEVSKNDYPVAIKKNKQKFIKIGIFYTVIQWLILGLTTSNNTPLSVSLFSLKVILSSIMSGVAYNGVMYLIFKNNVDIEKDE